MVSSADSGRKLWLAPVQTADKSERNLLMDFVPTVSLLMEGGGVILPFRYIVGQLRDRVWSGIVRISSLTYTRY
jgi:hypothetical protein